MNELRPKEQIKELLQKRHYKNRINFEAMGIKQSSLFCLKTDITLILAYCLWVKSFDSKQIFKQFPLILDDFTAIFCWTGGDCLQIWFDFYSVESTLVVKPT